MIINITPKGPPEPTLSRPLGRCPDGNGSVDDEVFHVEFDACDDDVAITIVRSVSAILGRSPIDLPPIGDVIDPDMLTSMVEHGSKRTGQGGEFTFTYEGFEITVDTDGNLWLERL